MKTSFLARAILLTLFLTSLSFAKGSTLKVVISGSDLSTSIEITDRGRLEEFNIRDTRKLARWSSQVGAPPASLKRYRVSFYANHHPDGLDYVITYVYDPVRHQGYVYLPGRGEEDYALNTFSHYRRVEDHWFLARKAWDDFASPLIG